MTDMDVQPVAEPNAQAPGLSQLQRVTNTFTAPSKTFEDIKRGNKSWWMPFAIIVAVGYIFFAVISMKVGMQTVVDNQFRLASEKQQEQMAKMTPEQREMQSKWTVIITEVIFYASPLLVLAKAAVVSLVLWGTINLVFGGKASFGGIFAVWFFASLPLIFDALLGIIVLFAGSAPEAFNIKNFAPTNLAAFVFPNPAEANKALYALTTAVDLTTVWFLILMGMGIAIVGGVKRTSGYIAVVGWWIITVVFNVGIAAIFS
jgi:hypothetical protein